MPVSLLLFLAQAAANFALLGLTPLCQHMINPGANSSVEEKPRSPISCPVYCEALPFCETVLLPFAAEVPSSKQVKKKGSSFSSKLEYILPVNWTGFPKKDAPQGSGPGGAICFAFWDPRKCQRKLGSILPPAPPAVLVGETFG